MTIGLLIGYLAFAVAVAIHATHDALTHRPGRYRYMRTSDQVVLAVVALVAGLFWIVLLPVYFTGWAPRALRSNSGGARVRTRLLPIGRGSSVSTARG
jgi:hypothetical protein